MKDLIENAPKIISEAAKSPLGISALLILAVSVLAWLFFGESSEVFKVPVFLAILLAFLVIVHYSHSYTQTQPSVDSSENEDKIVEIAMTRLPQYQEIRWHDTSDNISYTLTAIEAQILEALRGKPDVRWTKELIISSSRKPLYFSKEDLSKGIEELENKNYINANHDGIYQVLDLAIIFYRSTIENIIYEIDEADYWNGT